MSGNTPWITEISLAQVLSHVRAVDLRHAFFQTLHLRGLRARRFHVLLVYHKNHVRHFVMFRFFLHLAQTLVSCKIAMWMAIDTEPVTQEELLLFNAPT